MTYTIMTYDQRVGMTITPGLTYDKNGQEVADLENMDISTGNNLHWKDYQADIRYNPSTDEMMLDEEFDSDPDAPQNYASGDDQIVSSIQEIYPNYQEMVQFASQQYPQEVIDAYNEALDNGDWDNVFPLLEEMASLYEQASTEEVASADEAQVSDYFTNDDLESILEDVSDQDIQQTFNDIQQAVPEGKELAITWLQAAHDGFHNPLCRDMCEAFARFHNCEADQDELLSELQSNYSDQDLIAMYYYLTD